MELIQLWPSSIALTTVEAVRDNADALIQSLLSNEHYKPFGLSGSEMLVLERMRLLQEIIEGEVRQRVSEYVVREFGREPVGLHGDTWAFHAQQGTGMEPHLHGGRCLLSTALYLTESVAQLVLRDPRGNAVRGMPRDIREKYFANHRITPSEGTLVIFPCYLDHYVSTGPSELRIAILTDWYFK